MFCDELSEEEIHQAYLIYASLHGLNTEEESVRKRVTDYCKHNNPDELIDDAILAYAEDCIVAPPDVVLAKWGSSRFYELERSPCSLARHQTCESWFENGCRFISEEDTPRLVHFWTSFELEDTSASMIPPEESVARKLRPGTRLSLVLGDGKGVQEGKGGRESKMRSTRRAVPVFDSRPPLPSRRAVPVFDSRPPLPTVSVVHRAWGHLGSLPAALSNSLHLPPLRDRSFIALVDSIEAAHQPVGAVSAGEDMQHAADEDHQSICKLLVMSGAPDVSTDELVNYAAEAYLADRNKC